MNSFLSLLFLVGTKFASYKFDAAQKVHRLQRVTYV